MANNSDRSVEIPIYLRLDKKSYDDVNAEIARTAAKATLSTNDIRAKRGLPPRVSRSTPNVDIRQIAEKVAFDVAASMGDSNKLAKSIAEKLGKTTFNIAIPKISYDSQGLSEIENLPDVVEQYLDTFKAINEVGKRLSDLTGIKRTDIDVKNLSDSQLFEILNDSFLVVQKRIIPGLGALDEIYMQTVGLAGQLGVAAPGRLSQVSQRAPRSLPTGSYREFQSNASTDPVLKRFRDQFEKNPEAYSDAISNSIETWGKKLLKQTLDSLTELPEGEQAVEAGAQTLTFWLDDAITKFRDNMLSAGFEPGSEIEIATVLTNAMMDTIGDAEKLILDNLLNSYYTENSVNLASAGLAKPIDQQVFDNPALLTQGRMGKGALKELKTVMQEASNFGKKTSEAVAAEAKKTVGDAFASAADSIKEAARAQFEVEATELAIEGKQGWIETWQRLSEDESRSLEQRAESAKQVERLAAEQAELEKKLIEQRSKITSAQLTQTTPEQIDTTFRAQAKTLEASIRNLMEEGRQLSAAFDTEFAYGASTPITQASIRLRDDLGNFYDIFEMVHMVPKPDEDILASTRVGANDREKLEKLAKALNYNQPVGSEDLAQNVEQFYVKLKGLIEVIDTLAKLNVPMATVAGQGADFAQGIVNSVAKVNESITRLNLDLPKLSLPAGPYSEKTIKDPKYKAAFDGPTRPGSEVDLLKIFEGLPASVKSAALAVTGGGKTLGDLVHAFYDQFSEEVQGLIKLTQSTDAQGKIKRSFEFQGMPAHAARADTSVTALLYDLMSKMSARAPLPASSPPSSGLDARRQQGVPEEGYEPFLIQLKGMNSVLSNMLEQEKQIFLQKLKGFQTSQEQQKLYERQAEIQEEIARLEPSRRTDPAAANRIRELGDEELALQKIGAANERRFAAEVKFNYRRDNFAGKQYDTYKNLVDASLETADADKAAQSQIVSGMKEQIAVQKQLEAQNKKVESTNKSLMNTWVTGRYALYDVGNAYEGVGRQLAMVTRRIFEITNAFRSYETAFTSVERTLPSLAASAEGAAEEMRSIKDALIDMSEVMPIAFEELSQIATLGAQMGVSASGIVNFTETVAQFAAITGIAVDTVAQKFGRIAELADVDYAELNNLGSSIAFAGINAVATEAEILTLAESIAAVSNQAGLLPAEIIGVATSLASIGIQAEQARGVFTRVFADIDRAVSKNGEELQNFAAIAGMSVDGFAQAWGEDGKSYEVFRALLGGLGAAEDLTKAFDSLNIVETREINTLTRLSANLNVVDQAISDATSSFAEATFLGDAFEKTADNLDAKIQILRNNFNAFTESLSKSTSGALVSFIDFANDMLQVFKDLAKNDLFQSGASFGLILSGIATAATFTISAMTKLVAQMYAFRVAAINTANDASSMTGLSSMMKQITGFGAGLVEIRKDINSISPDTRGVITPMTFNAFSSFEQKQRKLLENNILLISSEAKLENGLRMGTKEARRRADEINQMIAIRQQELLVNSQNSAISEGERFRIVSEISARKMYVTQTGEIVRGKITEAEARKQNYIALNAESQAAVTAQRSLGGGLLTRGASLALGIASGLGTVLSIAALAGTGIAFLNNQLEKTKVNLLESGGGLASLRDAIKQDTIEYNKLTAAQKVSTKEYVTHTVKLKQNTYELNPNAVAIKNVTGVSEDFVNQNKIATEAISEQTLAVGKNTREWMANSLMLDENVQQLLDIDFAGLGLDPKKLFDQVLKNPDKNPISPIMQQVKSDYEDAVKVLKSYEFDEDSIVTEGEYQIAKTRMEQLTAKSHELADALTIFDGVGSAVSEAIDDQELYNLVRGLLGLTDATEEVNNELETTEEAAKGVAEALRTVLDYASDLSGIFSRVIELEFGKQIALDSITKGWSEIGKAAEDAAQAIEDAQRTIDEEDANRQILEYQLSVAERYGDELRAAKIRAELAQVNEKIADSEEKKAEAEARSSMSLVGNNEAAIENRATILGLVGEYQKYIETLAKLGRNSSQLAGDVDVLKRRFREQAIAAGFSASEVEEYVNLFDQFGQVAADAPRDVDIEVALGLSAAEQAIEEFLAKNRDMSVGVDLDTDDALTDWDKRKAELEKKHPKLFLDMTPAEKQWIDYSKTPKKITVVADRLEDEIVKDKINKLLQETRIISAQLEVKIDKVLLDAQAQKFLQLMRLQKVDSVAYKTYQDMYLIVNRLKNATFASGGMVSGPGTGTSDSIPAMLSNGEFVMKASAVRQYGPDFMNALNQQRIGFAPAASVVRSSSQGGPQIVYLSPDDRALLKAVADRPVTLYADNTKIAQSANVGNKKLSQRGVR